MNKIIKNLLKAIGVVCYFIVLGFACTRMNIDRLVNDIEVFSGVFLVLGILVLEKSYKVENGSLAITGIELLVLSMHSLSIMHITNLFKYDFNTYMGISSLVAVVYYLLKGIISYTKEKREYLKGLSDISEIVKEEPVKKEAKKRKIEELEENEQNKNKEQNKTKALEGKNKKRKAKKEEKPKIKTTKKKSDKNEKNQRKTKNNKKLEEST